MGSSVLDASSSSSASRYNEDRGEERRRLEGVGYLASHNTGK